MKLAQDPLAFRGRIHFVLALVFLGFVSVLTGYYRVQILQRERYEALGEKYRIKTRRVKATRGLMYDRNMEAVTQNMPTYQVVLQRDEMVEPWRIFKPKIASFLDIPEEELHTRFRQFRAQFLSLPIVLKEDVDLAEALRILRHQTRYPGLAIETSTMRYYVDDQLFAHVLGYVGEASAAGLKKNPDLKLGDTVGKSGLERFYSDQLTGEDGERTILIDNQGVFHSQSLSTPPTPGANLVLTLDTKLQSLAAEALGGHNGSILVMDVRTGELLVYISAPGFDPNRFSRRFTQKEWEEMQAKQGNPFLNRPLQGAYAPGSIFKVVTALAALKYDKISPYTKYLCTGVITYKGRDFHCHHRGGHGMVDLEMAIQSSCNVYFYQVAKDVESEKIAETARLLGFGEKTGLDLVGEHPGVVPDPNWKREKYNKPWFPGETLSLSIGQGDLLATPLQLLRMMGAVATEGNLQQLHFLKKTIKNGKEAVFAGQVKHIEGIAPEYFQIIKKAMWHVVNDPYGTGSGAAVPGLDVCGKTGTAQLITFRNDEDRDVDAYKNAWFAGFAPRNDPQIALLVLAEHSKSGGSVAAPIARKIIEAYFKLQKQVEPI